MQIKYHVENLRQIISDISVVANICIAFYDYNQREICSHNLGEDICSRIQHKEGMHTCLESDACLLRKCEKSHQVEHHFCYIGLCDLAMPVIKNDVITGYIILGRIRTPDTAAIPPEKYSHLADLYEQAPYFSYEKLECLKNLLPRILFSTAIEINYDSNLNQITDYIDTHLDEKLNISFLCSYFHISKDSLYEAFRETYNCTVNEYILSRRLQKAKILLTDTADPIYRITEAVGFENATYFCQLFKKKEGVSPSAYRQQHTSLAK